MVKITEDNKTIFRILYWGMAGSGKTTALNTLYQFTKDVELHIFPITPLTKIEKKSGATFYFDRALFQYRKNSNIQINIFTVAGQSQFSPLRQQIIEGTDGVIFVVDSQKQFIEENIDSLKELKKVTKSNLVKNTPLVVMLNKKDLSKTINRSKMIEILKNEQLWYEPPHELSPWTPIIYKACALYKKRRNIYRSLFECVRRVAYYHIFGEEGKAPLSDDIFGKIF